MSESVKYAFILRQVKASEDLVYSCSIDEEVHAVGNDFILEDVPHHNVRLGHHVT